MSRTISQGAYCRETGAMVPLDDLPLGSTSGTCAWCGKEHKVTARWIPGEGWVDYEQ